MKAPERRRLDFTGLRAAPSQVVGAVRLVPLLRDEPMEGLRLYSAPTPAELSGRAEERAARYASYVPHAMVVELDGQAPRASLGTQLIEPRAKVDRVFRVPMRFRRARRERAVRQWLLPQYQGLDAYLSLGAAGPDVAWPEYAEQVIARGLDPDPELEWVERGSGLSGFADALRVFEMHEQQVGVLVFVADAFASAFVTPRAEDYRRLHRTLLQDMFGELLVRYVTLYPDPPALWEPLDPAKVSSLEQLAAAVDGLRVEWARFAGLMACGLLEAELDVLPIRRLGRYRLVRFLPTFDPRANSHVGEAIEDEQGRLAYLKTLRLSAAQARRGLLLSTLVSVDWNLDDAAEALHTNREELIARMEKRGLGQLLKG